MTATLWKVVKSGGDRKDYAIPKSEGGSVRLVRELLESIFDTKPNTSPSNTSRKYTHRTTKDEIP